MCDVCFRAQFYLLGDQCMHVQVGDRLGLFFETAVPSVYYGEYHFSDKRVSDLGSPPQVGNSSDFEPTLTVKFVATGFIIVSK